MRRYRLLAFSGAGLVAVLAGFLFFGNLNENLVYYYTPDEAMEQRDDFGDGERFQLGGLVEDGSVERTSEGLRFAVTSGEAPGTAEVAVSHTGTPAQLFQSGTGVVLEGSWDGEKFVSDTMKVQHDENYEAPADDSGGVQS